MVNFLEICGALILARLAAFDRRDCFVPENWLLLFLLFSITAFLLSSNSIISAVIVSAVAAILYFFRVWNVADAVVGAGIGFIAPQKAIWGIIFAFALFGSFEMGKRLIGYFQRSKVESKDKPFLPFLFFGYVLVIFVY